MVARRLELETGTVAYWDGGTSSSNRPPLLLIHGFGAPAMWQWHGQVRALSRDRRVIAPDLLWFGDSVPNQRDFSVAHQANAVLQLLDALDVERVDVVGLSYGGFVAYELAAEHPDRVRSLIVFASPGPYATQGDLVALERRLGVADVADAFVPTDPDDVQRLVDVAFRRRRHVPRGVRRAVLRDLYGEHRAEQRELLHTLIAPVEDPSAANASGSVSGPRVPHCTPKLVLWAEDDEVFPLAMGRRLAEGAGARLEIIERAGHAAVVERPRRVTGAIRAFLADPGPGCDVPASKAPSVAVGPLESHEASGGDRPADAP